VITVTESITLEADGWKTEIDVNELEFKDGVKDDLPDKYDVAFQGHVYQVRIYSEAVAHVKVPAYNKYRAIERAKDQLISTDYEIEDTIHEEADKIDDVLIDENDRIFNYKRHILENYGHEYFKLKDWQIALLQSEDQSRLDRFKQQKQAVKV
jgi:hypothetical protein